MFLAVGKTDWDEFQAHQWLAGSPLLSLEREQGSFLHSNYRKSSQYQGIGPSPALAGCSRLRSALLRRPLPTLSGPPLRPTRHSIHHINYHILLQRRGHTKAILCRTGLGVDKNQQSLPRRLPQANFRPNRHRTFTIRFMLRMLADQALPGLLLHRCLRFPDLKTPRQPCARHHPPSVLIPFLIKPDLEWEYRTSIVLARPVTALRHPSECKCTNCTIRRTCLHPLITVCTFIHRLLYRMVGPCTDRRSRQANNKGSRLEVNQVIVGPAALLLLDALVSRMLRCVVPT